MQDLFPTLTRYSQCVLLRGLSPSKKSRGALTIYPTADTNPNTLQVWLYPNNLAELFSVSPVRSQAFVESVRALGESSYNSSGWLRLALSNLDKATEFARRFREFVDDANQVVPPNVASEVTQQGLASD